MTHMYYPTKCMQEISIDLKNLSWGTPNYLTIVETYSRMLFVYPLKRTTYEDIERCLLDFFAQYGSSLRVRSDNGSPFNSKKFQQFLRRFNIFHDLSTAYYPQGDSLVESAQKTLAEVSPTRKQKPPKIMSIMCALVLFPKTSFHIVCWAELRSRFFSEGNPVSPTFSQTTSKRPRRSNVKSSKTNIDRTSSESNKNERTKPTISGIRDHTTFYQGIKCG